MNLDELIPSAPDSAPTAGKIKYTAPAAPAIPAYSRIKIDKNGNYVRINNKGCKRKVTAIILAVLFGIFGIHDFYLGRKKFGIIKFLISATGASLIWSIIDIILIATGKMNLKTADLI